MANRQVARDAQGPLGLVTWLMQILSVVEIFAMAVIIIFGGAGLAGTPILPDALVPAYDVLSQSLFVMPWVLIILLMIWTFLVSKATHELSTEEMEHSPTLSAFFYIIPILSLWKPWEVVLELYQANRNPTDWKGSGKAAIVGWWWVFRIVSNITGAAISILSKGGGDQMSIVGVSLVVMILSVIALVMQVIIVSRITGWQATALTRPKVAEVF